MDPPDIAGFGMGKPSTSYDFTVSDTLDFEDGSDGLDLTTLRARIPLFGKKIGDMRFSISSRYDFTSLDSDFLGSRDLHEVNLSFQLASIPEEVEPGLIGFIRVQPGIALESGADIGDAYETTAIGVIGYKFSESFATAVGFYANYAYDDFVIYPAVGVIWRPSPNTYMQITPPLVNIAWKVAPKWTVFVNAYPAGNKWRLDEDGEGPAEIDLSLFRTSAGIEYTVTDNLRISLRGGINFLGELEVRDRQHRVLEDDDLDIAPFGAATVTWVF